MISAFKGMINESISQTLFWTTIKIIKGFNVADYFTAWAIWPQAHAMSYPSDHHVYHFLASEGGHPI